MQKRIIDILTAAGLFAFLTLALQTGVHLMAFHK
jgi:hypothetical protein